MHTNALSPAQQLGADGEITAQRWCERHGLVIVDHNVRVPHMRGEIDIIAADSTTGDIVFIEVKTRTSDRFGWPEESVTDRKAHTIHQLAAHWLSLKPATMPHCRGVRFDVLALQGSADEGFTVRHIKDAF